MDFAVRQIWTLGVTSLITLNKFLAVFDHQLLPMSNGKFTPWQRTLGTRLASSKRWFPLPLILHMVFQNVGEQRLIRWGPFSQFHSLVRGAVVCSVNFDHLLSSGFSSMKLPFSLLWLVYNLLEGVWGCYKLFLTNIHSVILGSRNNFYLKKFLFWWGLGPHLRNTLGT